MIPGQMLVAQGELALNAGRETRKVTVANTGDRPIQVGSHFHFFETNAALRFDRDAARGFRLNIAAGTAVRFEPGQEREVELVALGGDRVVVGFNAHVMGPLDGKRAAKKRIAAKSAGVIPSGARAKPRAKTSAKPRAKAMDLGASKGRDPSTSLGMTSKRGARK